jgi:hypothetical protein
MNDIIITNASWFDTVPHYGRQPFHAPLFSVFLHVGTTVSILPFLNCPPYLLFSKTHLLYGRIINYHHYPSVGEPLLTINLFAPFQQTFLRNKLSSAPANLEFVTEFVQTSSMIDVTLSQIHDICFMFSLKDIFSGVAFCEGIHNAFFI